MPRRFFAAILIAVSLFIFACGGYALARMTASDSAAQDEPSSHTAFQLPSDDTAESQIPSQPASDDSILPTEVREVRLCRNWDVESNISTDFTTVLLKDILTYTSIFAPYNSLFYYNQLNYEERVMYSVLRYMNDLGYESAFLYTDMDKTYADKVDLSLINDDPFYAANNNFKADNYLSGPEKKPAIALHRKIYIKDEIAYKLAALEKAKSIVNAMPDFETELEKGRYFYNYISDNIVYDYNVNAETEKYLYDALFNGVAMCDALASTLSLFYSLAGIECTQVTYRPSNVSAYLDKFDEVYSDLPEQMRKIIKSNNVSGHTWNLSRMDGKYYYIDPTGAASYGRTAPKMAASYFGMADNILRDYLDCNQTDFDMTQYLPECNDELVPTVLVDPDRPETIAEAVDIAIRDGFVRYMLPILSMDSMEEIQQEIIDKSGLQNWCRDFRPVNNGMLLFYVY